jgi:ankyrin repeat protein
MTRQSRRDFIKGPLLLAGIAALTPSVSFGQEAPGKAPASTRLLLEAVVRGELETVRELLSRDEGLLHARDGEGRSAYALAYLHHHPELGKLLLERGYRPDLHEAALAREWDLLEELLVASPGSGNRDHPVGGTALYAAAIGGAGSDIWRVYRYGDDPNSNPRGPRGMTALRAAFEYPDLAVAEMTAATLLANGGDPDAAQIRGSSALHAAARRGSLDLVEMLVRKGALVDPRDADGRTPLDLAESQGHDRVASLLRNNEEIPRDHSTSRQAYDVSGKPYVQPDLSSFSPVTTNGVVGSSHFNLEAVKEAVERHPELAGSVAATTERAVEACAHTGRKEIVDFLLSRGAPYSLPTAVGRNDVDRVKVLLDEDPLRIHERGPHDFALLWYPIIGRCPVETMELLLERGAEVERQHHLGTTALHWAALSGNTDMAELLLDRGAAIDRVGRKFDAVGQTPLDLARSRGHRGMVSFLKGRGARS